MASQLCPTTLYYLIGQRRSPNGYLQTNPHISRGLWALFLPLSDEIEIEIESISLLQIGDKWCQPPTMTMSS
eukprot:scaffold568_cov93-Skeletonema_marinoi.AAC.6